MVLPLVHILNNAINIVGVSGGCVVLFLFDLMQKKNLTN